MGKALNIISITFASMKIMAGIASCVRFIVVNKNYNAAGWSVVLAIINICLLITVVNYFCNQCKNKHKRLTILALLAIFSQIICFIASIVYAVMAISAHERNDTTMFSMYLWTAMMSMFCWISSLILTIKSVSFRRSILNALYDQEHGVAPSRYTGDDDEIISAGNNLNQHIENEPLIDP